MPLSNVEEALDLYFLTDPDKFYNDTRKIIYALSLLVGPAATWKATFMQNKKDAITGAYNFRTWTEFEATLKMSFEPANFTSNAMDRLSHLKQGA